MGKRKLLIIGIILTALAVGWIKLLDFAKGAEIVYDERGSWLTSTFIAHRGIHDNKNIFENTIPAFAEAIKKGYIIELDVSMTKDKKLVVFHDKKLKRLFGIDSYLIDTSYEELAELNFPNTNEKIPQFSDVLSFVDGQVPLLIEIKNEGEGIVSGTPRTCQVAASY
ncbi:MAG TPA: hypothetical protein GXZ75_07095 [Clostridia bacterium]|nr:hypothetical protein [Clostridia bacterium]